MSLEAHYNEYRKAVRTEALEGYEEYARLIATKQPQDYPRIFDYLAYIRNCVLLSIKENEKEKYLYFLEKHRFAMVALFERMVGDYMWDYAGINQEKRLKLIEEKGWFWFKFADQPLKLPFHGDGLDLLVTVIPRFAPKFAEHWQEEGRVVFDANEWCALQVDSDNYSTEIIRAKMKNTCMRLDLTQEPYKLLPIGDLNRGRVVDWTLPMSL